MVAYVHIHNPKRGIRIHVTPFSCSYSNEVAIIHLNIVVLVCREFRASLPEHCSVLSDAFPWFNPSNVSHATSNRTGQIQTILSALFCSVIFCVLNDLKILFFAYIPEVMKIWMKVAIMVENWILGTKLSLTLLSLLKAIRLWILYFKNIYSISHMHILCCSCFIGHVHC